MKVNQQRQLENLGQIQVYRAPSSSEVGKYHYVFVFEDSRGTVCSCTGFSVHGHCWHVDATPKETDHE